MVVKRKLILNTNKYRCILYMKKYKNINHYKIFIALNKFY